jgi:hypothetical protein
MVCYASERMQMGSGGFIIYNAGSIIFDHTDTVGGHLERKIVSIGGRVVVYRDLSGGRGE